MTQHALRLLFQLWNSKDTACKKDEGGVPVKRRLWCISLTLLLLFNLLPTEVFAADGIDSNEFPAEFDETDETIPNEMLNGAEDLALTSSVTIGGVTFEFDSGTGTIIGAELTDATSLTIPATIDGMSVVAIGDRAFSGKSGLEDVTIPASVRTVGIEAFARCTDLTTVQFETDESGGITTIGADAFKENPKLTSINLPETLRSIGDRAFLNCDVLAEVELPSSLTSLGGYAFSETAIKSITIPAAVTSLGEGVFSQALSLQSVTFENGCRISTIGANMFNQTAISSIDLPETVTEIGAWAFLKTDLTSITLPEGIKTVGNQAFQECEELVSAEVRGASIGEQAFMGCGKLETITMTDGGTSIGEEAFYNCMALKSVTIPDSVTSLGTNAFYMCTSMTDAVIGSGITAIPAKAFYNCENLQRVTFRGDVTSIGDSAFYANDIQAIQFPDTLQTIGDFAFFNNDSGLKTVSIPIGVVSIGEKAFSNCTKLESAYLWNEDVTIGAAAFEWAADGFKLYGYPSSTAAAYSDQNGANIPFADITETLGRTLTVTVADADGSPVTGGVTVRWYDGQGNDLDTTGFTFQAQPGTDYQYQVVLSGAALEKYLQPEMGTISAQDPAEVTVTLEERGTVSLSLRVADSEGNSLSGAQVTVTNQTTGTTVTGSAGADGACTIEGVPVGLLTVRVSLDGYYSATRQEDVTAAEAESPIDLGMVQLEKMVSDRITLELFLADAVAGGAVSPRRAADRLSDYQISLTDAAGQSISGFEVQGNAIVFRPDAVTAGETITVTVSDPKGQYTAAGTTVTLDGERIGSGQVTLTEKGGFQLGAVTGPSSATMLVFNADGGLVRTENAVSGKEVGPLEAGSYTVILLEKTEQLTSVPSEVFLERLGLSDGRDYLRTKIQVSDGVLEQLSPMDVPELTSLAAYTVAENTGVTIGKAALAPGEDFLLRVSYELDPQWQQEASALEIVLPQGINVEGNDVSVNGIPREFHGSDDGTIRLSVTDPSAVITVYAQAGSTPGEFVIGAQLELAGGNVQALGNANVAIESAKITAPQRTAQSSFEVSGKTLAGSTVRIYDDDALVGTVTANQVGTWKETITLAGELYSYSYHRLHAVIENAEEGSSVSTEPVLVVYDTRSVEVETIYMYNSIHGAEQETVYDFSGGEGTSTYYNYDSAYPTFTFKVEMKEGDSEGLYTNLCVYTIDDSGEITYIPLEQSGDYWYGTYDYVRSSQIPAQVGVAYDSTAAFSVPEDEKFIADVSEDLSELVVALADRYADAAGDFFRDVENPATGRVDVMVGSGEHETCIFSYETVEDPSVSLDDLAGQGFSALDEGLWIRYGSQDGHPIVWIADTKNENVHRTDYYGASPSQARIATFAEGGSDGVITYSESAGMEYMQDFFIDEVVGLIQEDEFWPTDTWLKEFIGGAWNAVQAWQTTMETYNDLIKPFEAQVLGNAEMLRFQLEEYRGILGRFDCANGETVAQAMNTVMSRSVEFERMIDSYVEDVGGKIAGPAFFNMLALPLSASGIAALPAGAVGVLLEVASLRQYQRVLAYQTERYNDINNAIYQAQLELIALLRQECEPEEPEDKLEPIAVPGNLDPSGFVYEAVPSNRLERVTATIYQETVLWDADDFDQKNPQTTGADGWYQWLVPTGNWKVTFSKEGYENTDTSDTAAANNGGWLVVPPPQMNVHVEMVSSSAPCVTTTVAYEDQVEIQFSQYMDIESVQNAVSMSINGTTVAITVTPLDAEFDLEGENQYATRFAVTTGSSIDGTVEIIVSQSAANYAEKQLGAVYASGQMTPEKRPTEIDGGDQVWVKIGAGGTLSLRLQPGIGGKQLTVENLTPSLLEVTKGSVVTDTSGSASLSLSGKMPGVGRLLITEPQSGLSKVVEVNIVLNDEEMGGNAVEKVMAYLTDGTALKNGATVQRGTQVVLRCATAGAEIRYTLDDTCPCQSTAMRYTDPIVITSETLIRAVAVKDGVYGETIRLKLYVEEETTWPDVPGIPPNVTDTLTFETNGGTVIAPIVVDRRESVDLTKYTTSREGYTFTGWYADAACTQRITSVVMYRDTVVYAGWEKNIAEPSFNDILPSAWYYDAVRYVYENGLMNGVGDNRFDPSGTTNRAMVVTILWRLEGSPVVSYAMDYSDVASGLWYTEAVRWATANSIVNGYDNGFHPGDAITREQLSAILYRYAQYKGYDVTVGDDLSGYTDASSVAGWAQDSMEWSVGAGLINGITSTTIVPQGSAIRAQVAAILMRFVENVAG